MWDDMRRCGCVAVRVPNDIDQCSHLHMGSLASNSIGDAGARDLGAALQVNTTLTKLR
jgi:trans-aconitate methyltransferase